MIFLDYIGAKRKSFYGCEESVVNFLSYDFYEFGVTLEFDVVDALDAVDMIDDVDIMGRDDLCAVSPICLVAVVFLGIVGCSDVYTALATEMTER